MARTNNIVVNDAGGQSVLEQINVHLDALYSNSIGGGSNSGGNDPVNLTAGMLFYDENAKQLRFSSNGTDSVAIPFDVETGNTIATGLTNIPFGSLDANAVDKDLNIVAPTDTTLATALAIKTYVDAQIDAQDLDVTTDSGTIAIDLDDEVMTIAGGTGIATSAAGNTVTLAVSSAVVTLTGGQTLVGKTLTSPDINGGTVDGITNFTVANDVDIGAHDLRAQTFTSDVTGTAPFTVASATKVTNLNADTVDGKSAPTSGDIVGTTQSQTLTNKILTSPDINSGTLDSAAINSTTVGATTPSTGKFTTLATTDDTTLGEGTDDSTTVAGDLTVNGAITTISSATLNLKGKNPRLVSDATDGGGVDGAGIHLGENALNQPVESFTYSNTRSQWETKNSGVKAKNFKIDTVDVIDAGKNWGGTTIPVTKGGTGAVSAGSARTNLVVDVAGTDNSTDVTLAGTRDYLTISNQVITRNQISIKDDTNLGEGTAITLGGTNKNLIGVNFGTSGSTATIGNDPRLSDSRTCNNTFDDAGTSRTALGLGNSATRAVGTGANQVSIGTHAHALDASTITGTLPVTKGGTGLPSIGDGRIPYGNSNTGYETRSLTVTNTSGLSITEKGSGNTAELEFDLTLGSLTGINVAGVEENDDIIIAAVPQNSADCIAAGGTFTGGVCTGGTTYRWDSPAVTNDVNWSGAAGTLGSKSAGIASLEAVTYGSGNTVLTGAQQTQARSNIGAASTATVNGADQAGTNADGLMSIADKDRLDDIADEANKYVHAAHTTRTVNVANTALTGANVFSDIDIAISSDAEGHVTGASASTTSRTLTLSNLGYTGATNANNFTYTHPTHDGDDISLDTGALTGATVISDLDFNVTTDTEGHVTDANATVVTRNLTLGNLGYTGASDANKYTHPTHDGDDINLDTGALTGATVISDLDFNVTTDTEGHVTDANAAISTRNLTAANVGAVPASANSIRFNVNGTMANRLLEIRIGGTPGMTDGTLLASIKIKDIIRDMNDIGL